MSQSLRMKSLTVAILLASAVTGCQQKMADQPAPRPYEAHNLFPNKQSARLLEQGTIHIGQLPADDPLLTWLTPKGKSPVASPEWKAAVDPNGQSAPSAGAPTEVANFVEEFPFDMTEDDLKRGQQRYNIYCAVCHGAAGHGNGKIVERGYLRPPSYHTDPAGKAFDWSTGHAPKTEERTKDLELKLGYSRGFYRYKIQVPLKDVPVGYIYQVITWGYGGMPEIASQVPPADRWRIAAYIRALQLSQNSAGTGVPADVTAAAKNTGPAAPHK